MKNILSLEILHYQTNRERKGEDFEFLKRNAYFVQSSPVVSRNSLGCNF